MVLLSLVILLGLSPSAPIGGERPPVFQRVEMPGDLHDALMQKLDSMGARDEGVFNEDISAFLSRYFPRGQTIEETRRTIEQQDLGALEPFKGHAGPDDGTMYVSRFPVMSRQFSHVFVVVDFGFVRSPASALVLDHVKAYLRADNM